MLFTSTDIVFRVWHSTFGAKALLRDSSRIKVDLFSLNKGDSQLLSADTSFFMVTEIWKAIAFGDGRYEVSSHGRCRIASSGKHLKFHIHRPHPYFRLKLWGIQDGMYLQKTWFVHRLVALAFIPNSEAKEQVNHIDGDKQNNKVSNLEWATGIENIRHAQKIGLLPIHKPIMYAYKDVYLSKKKKVLNVITGEKFDSIEQAADSVGLTYKKLQRMLSGERANKSPFVYEGSYATRFIDRPFPNKRAR